MGNCLFDSLNFYLKEKDSYKLRKLLVKYIRAHPELFKKDILANKYKSVDDYCDIMKADGRDGDGIVLQACVLLYFVKIVVYFNTAKNPLILEPIKEPEKLIYLKYTPGHYSVQQAPVKLVELEE